jgi:hypothetical protein
MRNSDPTQIFKTTYIIVVERWYSVRKESE